MAYVPPEYPTTIPDYAEIWPYVDNIDDVVVANWDALTKELRAALIELGTLPKGAKADVKTRLDDVDTAVGSNTTHRGSDGKDHSDVVANTAAAALNTTHRGSDGKDHSDVVANTTHAGSDGKDHSDVVANTTHRGSDGKDHSDVVANTTHAGSDGKDHSDVVANTTLVAAHHTRHENGGADEVENLGGIVDFPDQSRCRVYRANTRQTITKGGWVKIQLNGENYDSQNEFDSTTNYRFTATKAGYYSISALADYASSEDNKYYVLSVYKNGAAADMWRINQYGTGLVSLTLSDKLYLAVNDYVELYTYHYSVADKDIEWGSDRTSFAIHKLS